MAGTRAHGGLKPTTPAASNGKFNKDKTGGTYGGKVLKKFGLSYFLSVAYGQKGHDGGKGGDGGPPGMPGRGGNGHGLRQHGQVGARQRQVQLIGQPVGRFAFSSNK